ncbi:MAG: FixH family protein [Micavibrio aeruginosavorus]|nr:FixH family protein [Micavibrio aeruginosavorus]
MSANIQDRKPVDKFIPWMIVIFFVVLIAVDMIFVTVAVRTNTGVVSANAYEDGLHYNKTLDAAALQDAQGWAHDFSFESGVLRVSLKNAAAPAAAGAEVRAVFSRPVRAGHDFTLNLTEAAPGIYETRPDFPMPGQWNVRIYAQWQGQPYQFSRIVMAP